MVYISLGSNLGESPELLREAATALQKLSIINPIRSSLWRSAPVDCPPGSPDFVNAVVGLAPLPNYDPPTLLAELQSMEKTFGRKPKRVLNEARPLDFNLRNNVLVTVGLLAFAVLSELFNMLVGLVAMVSIA